MLAVLGDHQKVVSLLCSLPGVEVGTKDFGEMAPEDAAKSEAVKGIFNQLPLEAEAEAEAEAAAAAAGTVAGAAAGDGEVAARSATATATTTATATAIGTTESNGISSDEAEAAVTEDDSALGESGGVSSPRVASASVTELISFNFSLEIGSEVVRGPAWDCK